MLLFHDDRCETEALSDEARGALFAEFVAWADNLAAAGRYEHSEALMPNAEARTLRKRGETLSIDGPFAESQEAVNGFVTINAASLDDAATIAAECPSLRLGWAVEIRELREIQKPD